MKYIGMINWKNSDYEETTATTPEEIRQLGKAGWTKYDEGMFSDVKIHFYRKPKCFANVYG
jgi:hypothetical protein